MYFQALRKVESQPFHAFGYEFETYNDLKQWCTHGKQKDYALFHGMIVEYVKANSKAKVVNIDKLNI